ncbi:MAG: hypothetical protein BAA04_06510 [Firmicutes bacterium ZCTH02-B6]|nr:MAG: hypothetical protein BAA04_06510 [Firmicutes bacterium ZCTH02-B6]
MQRLLKAVALVLMLTMAAAFPALANGVVTVYGWSGDWDLWFQDWGEKFERETGIKVQYVSGGGLEMFSRLVAEQGAPRADVFLSSGSYLFQAANMGLLESIDWSQVPNASQVADQFKYDKVAVFGYDVYQIAYNTRTVPAGSKPTRWEDLADPRYKGRVIQRTPESDLTAWIWMVLADQYGEEYAWEQLVAMFNNSNHWVGTVGEVVQALSFGEADLSPASIGHIMLAVQMAGGDVASAVPDRPVLMLNGLGIVKNSPNPEGALKFVNFFLGEYVQDFIMNFAGTSMAVNSSVPLTNTALVRIGLGGVAVEDVLARAYLPDFAYWTEVLEDGTTRLGQLSEEIGRRVKGL